MSLAVAAVAACALPPVAAARSGDAVTKLVKAAAKHHRITGAQRKQYLTTWSSSARATHLHGNRGLAVSQVRAETMRLARGHRLTPPRMEAVFGNVRATAWVMRNRGFPAYGQHIHLPFDAAVYGYYPGYGVQLQPLYSFAWGNALYALGRNDDMNALADRMRELSVVRNGYRTWEYYFDWQGGRAPWNSAMPQATAMEFYARAWSVTARPRDLETARSLLPGFKLPSSKGGLMTSQGHGRWYLLYPFNRSQRILNGHLQSLLGLGEYAEITGDTRATTLQQQGITAVLPILDRFDTGAWSRYQYGQEADLNYHDLMTTQLTRLGNRTGIAQFSDKGHRFATYRATPPTITIGGAKIPVVYPVRDGWRDSARVRFFINKHSSVKVRVKDAAGHTMASYAVSGDRGWYSVTWDGWAHGRQAAAGAYLLSFVATDIVGNKRVGQMTRPIVVRHDTTPPVLVSARASSSGSGSLVRVRVKDAESPYVVVRIVLGDKVLGTARVKRSGKIHVSARTSKLKHGFVLLTDTSGNRTRVPFSH